MTKKKLFWIIFILLLIAGWWWWAKQPNMGKFGLKNGGNGQPTVVAEKVYDSDYLTFKYKGGYSLDRIPTTDGRVLENIQILGGTGSSLQMVITLTRMSQDLADVSSVQMRRANTWQYSEEIARMRDDRGLLFLTADKKERVAFFKKNDAVLSVAMTVNSNDPAYGDEFQNFLDNLYLK